MFQVICKIGPLSLSQYGMFVALMSVVSIAIMIVIAAFGRGDKYKPISFVLFWTMAFAIVGLIPFTMTVTVYSYGLMLAVAVVLGTLTLAKEAEKNHIKPELIFDLVFWSVIAGIAGARLFYVALNFSYFIAQPKEILMIQNGGLAWQGSLVGGLLAVLLFVRSRKVSFVKLLDLIAPYVALGQSIGRIGCFLNGCCYGKAAASGIFFPLHNAILHPTQLYLSVGYLLIFIILKRYQQTSAIPGLVFVSYLIMAAGLRFIVEFFRADHEILFLSLSIYQLVCVGVLVFAVFFAFGVLIKNSQTENLE